MKMIWIGMLAVAAALVPLKSRCETVASPEEALKLDSKPGWYEISADALPGAVKEILIKISPEKSAKAGVSVTDIALADATDPLVAESTIIGDFMNTPVKKESGRIGARLRDVAEINVVFTRVSASANRHGKLSNNDNKFKPSSAIIFKLRNNITGISPGKIVSVIRNLPVGKDFSLEDIRNSRLKTEDNREYTLGEVAEFDLISRLRTLAECNAAMKIRSDDPAVYLARGLAYAVQGKFGNAIDDCNKAIKLDPNDIGAYALRAQLYESNNEQVKADADYAKARLLYSDSLRDVSSRLGGSESDTPEINRDKANKAKGR